MIIIINIIYGKINKKYIITVWYLSNSWFPYSSSMDN